MGQLFLYAFNAFKFDKISYIAPVFTTNSIF